MLSEKQAAERRLQAYLIRRVHECRDEIAPELMEYVTGNSEAEIEATITLAKEATQQILARIRQVQARPDDADMVRFQADVQGGFGNDEPDVQSMSMAEYARERARLGVYKPMIDFLGGAA